MKIKTSELIGAALDWAVATVESSSTWAMLTVEDRAEKWLRIYHANNGDRFSTDWAQGGPIIFRERIILPEIRGKDTWFAAYARPQLDTNGKARRYFQNEGPSPLIAAMRCYVASTLGDEVDVPDELIQP